MKEGAAGVGRWVYGALFVVVLPGLLVAWAAATEAAIPIAPLPYPEAGWGVLAFGLALMAFGTHALWVHGHGLPMSPYPPPELVRGGVYRYVRHPIYSGFVLACFGASVAAESRSGIWLVTPMVALACWALVMGHERHEIVRRFGPAARERPWLALPPTTDKRPTGRDRLSILVLVFAPWVLVYEAVFRIGVPPDAIEAYLPFERGWPVLEWTEAIYGSVYLFVPGALLVARSPAVLRRLAVTGWTATVVVTLIYLTVPLIAPPRPFEPQSILGEALRFERTMSNTVAAFPAFHVIWTFIAAEAWASRGRIVGRLAWLWGVAIAVSCLTTGMHALVDVVGGVLAYFVLRRYRAIWERLRRISERLANSWREWRLGPARVIVHGGYAALAGALGVALSTVLAGPEALWQVLVVYLGGLLGAALWAQKLEGSSTLSRPFGYFGSVFGAVAAGLAVGLWAGSAARLLAALAAAAPWVQAVGRLRCLVQGCCHGARTVPEVGIRYRHPRSRVVALAALRDLPLHPTPLYSILANLTIGLLLIRLWIVGAPLTMIAGGYLLLAGAARFVEEAYRGEPQTPIVGSLRLYQWLAVASFLGGAAVTAVPSAAAPAVSPLPSPAAGLAALAFGLLAGIAMGVDFPESSGRFTRLAPR